ncbi:small secreted protein [Streptomyces sp. M19]
MNKKLVVALSGGAALVMALTGCTDDNGDKKVNAWAETVCDELQRQDKEIREATASIRSSAQEEDAKKLQKTDSAAFQQLSDAYGALAKSMKAAGAPPVDDGEKTQTEVVKTLTTMSTKYGDLKTTVDKLDTGDKGKVAEGLQGIADELDKLSKSGASALKKLDQGKTGKAMAKQPGCQRQKSSSASASASASAER